MYNQRQPEHGRQTGRINHSPIVRTWVNDQTKPINTLSVHRRGVFVAQTAENIQPPLHQRDKGVERRMPHQNAKQKIRSHAPHGFGNKGRDALRRGRPGSGRTTTHSDQNGNTVIPEAGENIRIIPLGGVEEIGKNMTVIEYGGDIVVIDMGFQFTDENTPGIDYILPNTRYLEERKDRIRAVFITHGHLDHIGGIPYVMV